MAYRNQNYMTNKIIKEAVDKNQKNYIAPTEEEIIVTANINVLVKNTLDELIENAVITLTNNDESFSGTTNEEGICEIQNVPLNTYNVIGTADSYISYEDEFTVQEGNNNLNIVFTKQQFQIDGPTFEETEEEDFF